MPYNVMEYYVIFIFPAGPWTFEFCVKFYPPEPTVVQEDITRLISFVLVLYYCSSLLSSVVNAQCYSYICITQ